MLSFAARRVAQITFTVLLISVICFVLMHAVPGGPTGVLADNPKVKPEDIARMRANFGLDDPLPVQYTKWLGRVMLHGDFGRSYVTGEPVLRMIAARLPATLELMGTALLASLLVSVIVGLVGSARRHTWTARMGLYVSLALISIPVFWSGLVAIMLFSVKWKLVPSGGMFTIGAPFSISDHLRHLVLPSAVLALVFVATWSRYLSAALSEVLDEKFIGVARAKGLSPLAVLARHGLRNAAAPVVTVVALHLPVLFTGTVIVETIFSWPGMGRLFYEGLLRLDYSRLMGIVFFASVLVAVFNLFADLVYGFLDPRIKSAR
jgi:peptide/nickel transport system permease protein